LQLRRPALTIPILVAFLVFVLTLITLLGLVLAGLAGLSAVLTLSGLATLLALSGLLIFLLHVICHKTYFLPKKTRSSAPSEFNRNLRVSCRKRLQRLGYFVAVRKLAFKRYRSSNYGSSAGHRMVMRDHAKKTPAARIHVLPSLLPVSEVELIHENFLN
jgi:hypothetical protein